MRIDLATQVLLGMFLGVLTGIFFGEMVEFLKVAGQAFLMMLQMTVIPYIVVALVVGIGRLNQRLATSAAAAAARRGPRRAGSGITVLL